MPLLVHVHKVASLDRHLLSQCCPLRLGLCQLPLELGHLGFELLVLLQGGADLVETPLSVLRCRGHAMQGKIVIRSLADL